MMLCMAFDLCNYPLGTQGNLGKLTLLVAGSHRKMRTARYEDCYQDSSLFDLRSEEQC